LKIKYYAVCLINKRVHVYLLLINNFKKKTYHKIAFYVAVVVVVVVVVLSTGVIGGENMKGNQRRRFQ